MADTHNMPYNFETVLNPACNIGFTEVGSERLILVMFHHPRFGPLNFAFTSEHATNMAALLSQIVSGEMTATLPAQMN